MEQLAEDNLNPEINNTSVGLLTGLEIDALGESVNISMGAAAKVLSTMLNLKVLITTPEVTVLNNEDFEYKSMFPAVGVAIKYIEGLSGINFFVIKQTDVKKIVEIMLGNSNEDGEAELTDLHISAVSEVMNQMMGASSTSLAAFFNRKINISTPDCIMIREKDSAKESMGLTGDIVVIKLKLMIGDIINSELVNIMPVGFAKELAENLINVQLPLQTKGFGEDKLTQPLKTDEFNKENDRDNVNNSNTSKGRERANKKLPQDDNVSEVNFADFNSNNESGKSVMSNLNIIMDVPLDVVVQIGKAQRQVKDIIKLTQGSIIELEKQAGDPVDIIVNGEMIAKGDVVVIDDNFGVRITEILNCKV